MQLFALENTAPIAANLAEKGKNYLCPECRSHVRVRGGPSRQSHFYHITTPKHCRQHKKSLEHLQLQLKILHSIGELDAQIECPFPSIQRIADVAWHEKKIIFEIQCSPISLEETQSRNHDYRSIGYEVIWILHEKKFNQKKLSAAENYLRNSPCYFTDIDKMANGVVYDQFDVIKKHLRLFKGPKLPLSIHSIHFLPKTAPPDTELPQILLHRLSSWKCYTKKDLLHRWLQEGSLSKSTKSMLSLEKQLLQETPPAERLPLCILIAKTYRFLLHTIIRELGLF